MTKKISKTEKKKKKNRSGAEILCSFRRCRGITFPIDLFSLYVLFSISDHVMQLEGIVSFKCRLMHVQLHAYLMIKTRKNSHEGITWSEMGKQSVQAKKVYYKRKNRSLW